MDKVKLTITEKELITILSSIERPTFTNVLMETNVRMNKTNNPYFNQVKKLSSRNYSLGIDYKKRVENNMVKENFENVNYEVSKPSGKHHVGNSKCLLIDDKTESTYYVMLEYFDEIHPQTEYVFEGNSIDKQIFESFLVKVSESNKQQQDNKVSVITPKIESIKEISISGVRYTIEH